MRPFVFLDRDGTLIVEKHYLHDPDAVEVIPGAGAALVRLRTAGFGIAIVTNQAGVGRGYYGLADVDAVNARLRSLLSMEGAALDAIYVCVHAPADGCACRKPGTALLEAAAAEHRVDLEASFIIGDKESDIDCGKNAGVTAVLVRTGYGGSQETMVGSRADFVADSVVQAVDWILSRSRQGLERND
jgi:D-glycero-D-manno-heptose 1,7-bisphosphate phosphatase